MTSAGSGRSFEKLSWRGIRNLEQGEAGDEFELDELQDLLNEP